MVSVKNYLLDTEDDIADLPINAPVNSTAEVLKPHCIYKMNNSMEWVKQPDREISFNELVDVPNTIAGYGIIDAPTIDQINHVVNEINEILGDCVFKKDFIAVSRKFNLMLLKMGNKKRHRQKKQRRIPPVF